MVSDHFLEELANDFFMQALEIAKLDEPTIAIDYFSIAFGLYRQVENTDLMHLSVKWLSHLGLEGDELKLKLNYGTGLARYGIDIVDVVNAFFQPKDTYTNSA